MKTKNILFVICILLFSALSVFYFYGSDLFPNRRINIEIRSITAFENIMHTFSNDDGTVDFHENFAGAYLNSRKQLVLLISPAGNAQTLSRSDFRAVSQEFTDMAGIRRFNNILFKEASFSFSYLTELMQEFNDAFLTHLENPGNADSMWNYVTSFTIQDRDNFILVEILDIDDSKIERFRSEISDSRSLVFENSRITGATAESLHPGMMANTGSMGFRARMGSYYGFVTAGHNAWTGGSVMRIRRIGTCIISIVDSRLDGAFVRTDHLVGEISNTTHRGREIYGINIFPLHGATVFKEGRATGLTAGNILSTNATHQYGLHRGAVTITRTNMVVGNYLSAQNDSGGIVYDIKGRVLGIHIAGPGSGGPGERFIEKAVTIQNVLGVEVY